MDKGTFGRLLRRARQRSLLTIEGLAEASGVSGRAISDMERGHSLPRQSTLAELMDALGLDEDERSSLVRAASRRAPQAVVPRQLPPDLAQFRGRDAALATVHDLTDRVTGQGGHVVISAIGGMAGVGKTTLAVRWAHQVADRFPDGQLYVNLRGFEASEHPLDPGEALGGFLRALGVPSGDIPSGVDRRGALFRELTADRRLIAVLDNAKDPEQVGPLLPTSPGCLTIVTSRNQLSGLVAVEGAASINLDVWGQDEALAALAARIGEERCREEPEAAAELVGLCGFLPLAVAVVGAQLSSEPRMPLRLAVRELRRTRPRLDALATDDLRVDVRTVFSWSYRALTAGTARFFRYVSLHPGPAVSAEAAATLAGVELTPARRHLRALTAASLLSRDADGRYIQHDLVRAYGGELADQEDDDRLGAQARLLDYLRHNAHTANRHVSQLDPEPEEQPLDGVVHVVLADRDEALHWFRQEESAVGPAVLSLDDPRLLRLRGNCAREWIGYNEVVGRWSEEIGTARVGLDAGLALDDPVATVRSRSNLTRALLETGHTEEVEASIDAMLADLHRLPPEVRARIECEIGFFRIRQGRFTEALLHPRRALEIYRGIGRPDGIASTLSNVGWVLAHLGEYEAAIATCEEALPLLRQVGDRRFEAGAWDAIGRAQQGLGRLDAAVTGYRTALRLFEELLDDYNRAGVLDHLASAQLEQGEEAQARANWVCAAELLTALRVRDAAQMWAKAESLPSRAD
ncbi:ATP-binding protein [Streptomyces longispororuber]|uniref:ATP-binding protein n=1 Tax=Streptomyces longispororuber TaxID=68230 RepID=UPI00210E32D1|nr:helix-turn-helix domain-containing protein [Streptomyces longispororuber]MCQ4207958.1 tetratricopeptide repeat protein [Streptomyces longispororuber]